jgi:hypothetical protein
LEYPNIVIDPPGGYLPLGQTTSQAAPSFRDEGRGLLPQRKRWWVRLHEKGGKFHELPAHHILEEYLDAYLQAAGIDGDPKTPLFRPANRK